MVMDPPAIRDVNLCHILPPRGDFHQEIIVYLGNRGTPGEIKDTNIKTFCLIEKVKENVEMARFDLIYPSSWQDTLLLIHHYKPGY